jgi:hypothetical protein
VHMGTMMSLSSACCVCQWRAEVEVWVVVANGAEEGLCSLCSSLELRGSIYIRDMLLESLSNCGNGSVHNP